MSKRRTYDKAFKEQAVALSMQEGVSAAQVTRELGIRPELLYKWRAQSKAQGEEAFLWKGYRPASEEAALRRELERVRMERDILKKRLARACPTVRANSLSIQSDRLHSFFSLVSLYLCS